MEFYCYDLGKTGQILRADSTECLLHGRACALCVLSPSVLTSPCGGSFCYLFELCARSHTAGRWWRRNLNPRDPWPLPALAPRSGDLSGHRTPKLRKNSCRLWESCIQVLSGDHQTGPDECVSPWRLALGISHHPHINTYEGSHSLPTGLQVSTQISMLGKGESQYEAVCALIEECFL